MPVSFAALNVGSAYTRKDLSSLWGYQGHEAISRGVITPKETPFIILFITRDKRDFLTQYSDSLLGDRLHIEGEAAHGSDARMAAARSRGDQIHLFYRERHPQPFVYHGEIFLISCEMLTDKPSRFQFSLVREAAIAQSDLETELLTHGVEIDQLIPEEEGRRIVRTHVAYERSAANRVMAIKTHGTRCAACGFDFNAMYGEDHADSYIEIHHVRPVASGEAAPRIAEDLAPLCSNCHSMAHRRKGMSLGISEIKALIVKAKASKKSTGSF